MPSKAWLRQHYAHLPDKVQLVFINKSLSKDVRVLSKLQLMFPNIYAIHAKLEDRFLSLGCNSLALRKWSDTRKRFPRLPNPYFQRASWALEKSKFFEAALYMKLCLKLDKGYFKVTAHFWRAEALYRLGNYDLAKRELESVPEEYEEVYFLEYKKRSKSDLLRDIGERQKQV